jgi:hypothetical protein
VQRLRKGRDPQHQPCSRQPVRLAKPWTPLQSLVDEGFLQRQRFLLVLASSSMPSLLILRILLASSWKFSSPYLLLLLSFLHPEWRLPTPRQKSRLPWGRREQTASRRLTSASDECGPPSASRRVGPGTSHARAIRRRRRSPHASPSLETSQCRCWPMRPHRGP